MTSFPLGRPARLAVLVSGRGTNLEALVRAFPPGNGLAEVKLVISNRRSAPALEKARLAGVEARCIAFGDAEEFGRRATAALRESAIDLICLAGFMRVLPPSFVSHHRGRILNIHPSLLPSFRGLHAQRQALTAGVAESGCTVHFVDEGVDTGGIILQRRVPVLQDDDEEALADRIRVEEHRAYPEAVRKVLTGQSSVDLEEVRR